MYRKIVCALDIGRSQKGERLLRRAAALVDDGGEIIVVHVVENVPSYLADLPQAVVTDAIRDSQENFENLCHRMAIPAIVTIRTGRPATAILAIADERKADLIIVGSHIPDFSNYFLGATADRIVRHAKCSVLVERG
ncbi:universal stress protein [Rhizobium calliandrae]|uniref:Universal stress protein n=1 Tax=Rhizobium calliandrae TaxID=1312182 RepID=A0ABT7KJ53_9HYPH|nr:universal stress protein [Rhizobium calliandrae]MDL2408020.1 universal stress protein [Rhizobium calliandrae]